MGGWRRSTSAQLVTARRHRLIAFESLRRGYSELVKHMPRWIERKLDFDDDGDQCRVQLWRLCGLTQEIIDVLLDVGLRYESGLLKVRSRWRGHRELPDLLAAVMLHTWRWKKLSDSRWISFGASCRCLLGSLLLGLQDYLTEVLATPGTSTLQFAGVHVFGCGSIANDCSMCMLVTSVGRRAIHAVGR